MRASRVDRIARRATLPRLLAPSEDKVNVRDRRPTNRRAASASWRSIGKSSTQTTPRVARVRDGVQRSDDAWRRIERDAPAPDGSRGLARQRSFDSPASADRDGDVESNAPSRSALSTPKGHAQGRAIGSLAHLAAVAMKRKSILVRVGLAFALIFWVAAETARRLLAPDHCEALPSTAPVAVLLAGSFDVFNRTHCSFTRRVVEPLRARGHPVVVFAAFDDAVDERTRADAFAALAHVRRRVPGVEIRVERASASRRFDSNDAEEHTTSPPSSSSSSFVGASALHGARDDVESSAYDFAPPASCVSALRSRFDPNVAASPRPAGARVRPSNEDADEFVEGVGHDSTHASRAGSDRHAAISRASLAFLRMLRARAQANACGENTNAPPGRRSRGWCPRNLTWRSRTIFRRIGCARCPGEGACTRRGFTAAAG